MSDTPRTDAVTKKSVDEDDGEYLTEDLLFHARELEREIRQLEVAIYDFKTENNELQNALTLACEDRDYFVDLYKMEKERLDWILEHCDVGYDKFYKTSFENRDEIDQAMEDAQ